MKGFFYKLGKQTAVTVTMLLLVFAPFASLSAQAQSDPNSVPAGIDPNANTSQSFSNGNFPATSGSTATNVNSISGANGNTGNASVNNTANTVTNPNSVNTAANTTVTNNTTAPSTSNLFGSCTPLPGYGFNASNCIRDIIYAFTIGIASIFAYVAAYFFDITIQLSLNGASYGLDFVSTSWTTARDLGNMAFLFILLYIAFTIIFKADTSSTKTMLATVILVALLVNFSFFFTRVVIDAGNILSIQFYNAIPAQPISQTIQGSPSGVASYVSSLGNVAGGTKDLTASIMNMLNVQGLLNNNSFSLTNGNFIATIFIYIAGAIVLWLLAIAFITNGIKFLVRVVVLWFLIIASPLALIAIAVQGTGGYFKKWRELLVQHAFYPVAFMFIFLVLNNFATTMANSNTLTGGVFTTTQNSGGSGIGAIGASLVALAIRLALVIAVLYIGMKASDSISVKGSEAAGKIGGWFGGKVKNTYSWAGGAAYRNTGGRAAAFVDDKVKNSRWANTPGTFGGLVGYRLRQNVLAPAKATSLGTVAASFDERQKYLKDRKATMGENLRDRDTKDKIAEAPTIAAALKPLEEIAKNFKEFTELQAKSAAAAAGGPALSADEATRLAYHVAAGTTDLTTAQKTHKDELNNRMEDIKDRVKNLSKREVEAMDTDTVKSIVHLMGESQAKAIKESEKRSDKDKDDIYSKWQEEASGGALQKANKEIEQLRKIEHDLRASGVALTTISTTLGTKYAPHAGNTIDSGKVEAMVNNVNAQIAAVNSAIRAAPAGASTVVERQNLNNLQKALKTLEKLDDARSNVPANVGGEVASGKFKTK